MGLPRSGTCDKNIITWFPSSGRVAEWFKAPDSKSDLGATLAEVRILSLPPFSLGFSTKLTGKKQADRTNPQTGN